MGVVCWFAVDQPTGWDFAVTQRAIHSLRNGTDPYLNDIAAQNAYLQTAAAQRGDPRPFVYVYPPITLQGLRAIAAAPDKAVKFIYWTFYVLMVLAQLLVARRLAMPHEKYVADLLAPLPLFFPGLLLFDSVLGGNIAFILFGLIFLAAWRGWTRGHWAWFYAAVFLASCVKVPYLTLLAIPLLSAPRQWLSASAIAAAGLALFAMQIRLWPVSFRNYLQATNRMFSFNHDFGSGPAGRVGASLAALHLPSTLPSVLFYLVASLTIFFGLYRLSRAYRRGYLTREQWIPLMMVGVLLLNPRLIEYEIFPFTFFMAIIGYRLIAATKRPRLTGAIVLLVWVAANCAAEISRVFWRNCECALLVSLFLLGYRQVRRVAGQNASLEPAAAYLDATKVVGSASTV
ncbi:MAG TPA: glycosyltransferase 87 family protein [Acidobacteriaceae bacterium]|nr:glycosyltransferase 87 family protein [Acidobacteriaceae bacterium]